MSIKKTLLAYFVAVLGINSYAQSNNCTGIPSLALNASCVTSSVSVNQNGTGLEEATSTCTTGSGGVAYSDGWYTVTGDGNTITITLSNKSTPAVLTAWTACGAGAEIACDAQAAGVDNVINFASTNGTTYYIQVQRKGGAAATNTNLSADICAVTSSGGTYTMGNSSETTCAGTFFDSGGSGGPYSNNELYTMTFTPDAACSYVQLAFSSFSIESGWDDLFIYDGPNASSPLIGSYTGTTSPGTVTATNATGQLTVVFDSDGSTTSTGWEAAISCVSGAVCAGTPSAGTAVASPTSINCTVTSSNLSATGLSTDCDISYQWQSSPDNAIWTNIAGATNTTLNVSPTSNTYYRIVTTCANGGASNNSSSVLVSSTFSPPANDECATATALTVNADYNCGTTTAGTVACASGSADANGCFGTSNDDVWYSFVATQTQHRISLLNIAGSETDMYHGIYTGACGALTELNCNDGNTTNMTGLTIGVTYYVRVYNYYSGAENTTFDICIGGPPPPPTNDEPCSATAATVNADLLCGSVTAGSTYSATDSGIGECVGSGSDDDVWFSFVATSTVHNFDLLNITGTSTDMVMEVFSGACGSLSSIACSDPQSAQFSGFTIGATYFMRVHTYYTGDEASFNLCIGTPPPPPTNDEPCGAIDLNVNNGSCSFQSAVLGTSSTVSTGMSAPGCGSLNEDIWYKFTVPASGRVIIDMADNGGPNDMDMAWYTSSTNDCNNLDNLIECDDADSQNGAMAMICHAGASCVVPGDCQQNGVLTPGTVVYVRLWDYDGTFGGFDICAYDPGAPGAPSTCATATSIAGLPYSNSGQTTCCKINTYTSADGCGSAYQAGEDFMYEYTPSSNESVDVTLTGTLSYTGIFITDDCPDAGGVNCVASSTSFSGNPTLCGVNLTAGTTYYIMIDTDPSPTCTPFNLNVSSSSTPSCGLNYSYAATTFAPDLNAGTDIALPTDDRFSSSYIPLGFDFCFDGFEFTQVLVSSNGYVVFDPIGCSSNMPGGNAAPGNTSDWSISAAIPNTNDAPRNAIMFPWQDVDPSVGGTIKYQTLGTAPNRRFVLTFDNVPYFSCNSLLFTGQLKMFETTNDIEMHITNKEICAGWNGGDAILGIHNYNGTVSVLGINYPTNWTATNQAAKFTYNCPGPCITLLPVNMLNFDGLGYDNYNVINWKTATEKNNDYFLLERSSDGHTFTEIAQIDGNGNSNEMIDYNYVHRNPNELEYYRLKQVDFDGKFEYSKVIAVNSKQGIDVNIFPNPTKHNFSFSLSESYEGILTISYANVLGDISKETIPVTKGNNTYQVQKFEDLDAGIYFVQIVNDQNEIIKTQKIIKQ